MERAILAARGQVSSATGDHKGCPYSTQGRGKEISTPALVSITNGDSAVCDRVSVCCQQYTLAMRCIYDGYAFGFQRRSSRALAMTLTEESAIAAPASTGLR